MDDSEFAGARPAGTQLAGTQLAGTQLAEVRSAGGRGGATPLERRLAELRGNAPARRLDARALAALAANPGCRRRAVLDAAGVDKAGLAERLGTSAGFGQSPFAITRGLAFERRLRADGCAELLTLLQLHLGAPEQAEVDVPDLLVGSSYGPAVRVERSREALAQARPGAWTLLDHPMLRLEVAGSTAYLEPDAVAVSPSGRWTVIEIKSFPILDGTADPAHVGAAARQAAVYVLALQALAAEGGFTAGPAETGLLVCPRDFSSRPAAAPVDLRKQLAVTRRQLQRLTRIEELLDELSPGTRFDTAPQSVDELPHAYTPDCLSSCELAFHCRAQARAAGSVDVLGRGARGELGGLRTVAEALAAADPAGADPAGAGRTGGPVRADAGAEADPSATRQRAEPGTARTPDAGAGAGTDAGADLPDWYVGGSAAGTPGGGSGLESALTAQLARAAVLRAEALGRPLPTGAPGTDLGPDQLFTSAPATDAHGTGAR